MSRLSKEELIEAIRDMTREELFWLVEALEDEFSLPPVKEKKEWIPIPPSVKVLLTGFKPEMDRRQIIFLIRELTFSTLKEARDVLVNNELPITLCTIYDILPHQIPPILKRFEDLGAIVDYDYDWGNFIE